MDRLSISKRMIISVGTVMVMLLGFSAFSYIATSQLGSVFTEYRSTAKQTLLINELADDLAKTKLAAGQYRFDPSEENASSVNKHVQHIIDIQEDARTLFANEPQALEDVSKLEVAATEYRDAFQRMTLLEDERRVQVEILTTVGPKARAEISELMKLGYDQGNVNTTYYAGLAQQELMLSRYYMGRYLLTNEPSLFERYQKHMGEAKTALTTLRAQLNNATSRTLVTATLADFDAFATAAVATEQIVETRNDIAVNTLDVLGPKAASLMSHMLELVVEHQNKAGGEGAAKVKEIQSLNIFASLASIAIGLIVAIVIGRAISRSLDRMAVQMSAIANNELDVEITGQEYDHELGRMAKALDIFKDNSKQILEQRAERRRLEEENRAARRRMMEDLQNAFGSVVSAAVAGDFSRRVDMTFDDAELNNLATGLNDLVATVDKGVTEVGRIMSRLSEGDVRDRMHGEFGGAFAELKSDVNGTVRKIGELLSEMTEVSEQIATGSTEIADSAQTLSHSSEAQASSLEETAGTMEEMATSVRTTADNSQVCVRSASDAAQKAQSAQDVVTEAISAMSKIDEGSSSISNIISVIDGIAFQTSLLALNAAVEAARAGEAGKGFAVVASEVRTLAQQSSDAARDIRELIQGSEGQVKQGVSLVEKTGNALRDILAANRDMAQKIEAISQATEEQANGVSEVNTAITSLDQITQSNALRVEASADRARELHETAEKMRELVSYFNIGDREEFERLFAA